MTTPPGPVPLPPNIGSITSSQLIGTLLNFFLFGTLFIQVYVYSACFPKDRPAIKWLVYIVFLTMALCVCLNAADAHYWYASGFGDITKFGQALLFCYRISVFRSGAIWWSGLIAMSSLVQAVGGVGGGVKAFIASNEQHDPVRTILVYMWLVGDAVADLLIAATMTYVLTQASESQTRTIVRGVVRLVIETNTFSASVAIVGLVLFATMPTADYFICPWVPLRTMILPGIYSNTLLVLLNNRVAPFHSRSNLQADYVSSDNAYISGESTANGSTTMPWKVTSLPATHLDQFNDTLPPHSGRRRFVPDEIPIGAFVAAPNPHDTGDAPQHLTRPAASAISHNQNLMSTWDDTSYSYKDSAAWDAESLDVDVGADVRCFLSSLTVNY
ncbi:hypothetical protein K438DRAFT_1973421 [Mycena galopus ATCC 62051]|nr:hypothetical protein K438DRAFT_1973421 [Mycena galopus ATCC 62051]